MAIFQLPVQSSTPFYDFATELEGASYVFEMRWNERMGAWFLSLSDYQGQPIVSGRQVVLNADLLGRAPSARKPPGLVFALDSSGRDQEAGREDLGDRVQLYYVEAGDLA